MKPQWSAGTLVLSLITTTAAWRVANNEETERHSIERRASNLTIPAAINIAPSQYWDGNDGPWSSFPLQVGGGSNTQNVRVLPSTTGYNVWTIGAKGCPDGYVTDCANKRGFLFNPNSSLTYVPESIYPLGIEDNLGLDASAYAGYDTVIFGWQGSGGPTVEHTVVFNVYSPKYWLGIFGLNPLPTNFTNLNSPQKSYMQSLYDNSLIPSRSYGYTAGNQYRLNKVFGSLTLGGYDQNRFTGGASFPMYTDISRDLLVYVKSITTGSNINLLPDGKISAFVDSTVPHLWLPQSACTAFEQAFGLTYNSSYNLYLIDGATHANLTKTNPSVNITLTNDKNQDVVISMPYGAFDLNVTNPIIANSTYYFPLQQAANDTQYTLGRAFFQEAYLIADYDNNNFTVAPCQWDQSKLSSTAIKSILSPNLTAEAAAQQADKSTTNHGISVGAIVGIVVGVVMLILVAVAIWFLIRRRKRNQRRQLAELNEKGDAQERADAKLAHGSVNEIGDGEVGELDAPYMNKASEMESPYKVDPNRHGYTEMEGEHYGPAKDWSHEMEGEHYGPGKDWSHEMDGTMPIYEMHGSDVHEMPSQRHHSMKPAVPPKMF